nr:MAG TPA: hypothetical protein [Caudoviricetes sp.]
MLKKNEGDNESICQEGRCFFCARSDPGIFVPFFMGFRG